MFGREIRHMGDFGIARVKRRQFQNFQKWRG